jgi:hypothetical protein
VKLVTSCHEMARSELPVTQWFDCSDTAIQCEHYGMHVSAPKRAANFTVVCSLAARQPIGHRHCPAGRMPHVSARPPSRFA